MLLGGFGLRLAAAGEQHQVFDTGVDGGRANAVDGVGGARAWRCRGSRRCTPPWRHRGRRATCPAVPVERRRAGARGDADGDATRPEAVGDAAAGGAGPAGEEDEGCGGWSWRPLNSSLMRRSIDVDSDSYECVYTWHMDRMSALLDGPRARGAFVIRCLLQPPWAIHVRDRAPLTVVAAVRGDAWITQSGVVVHVPEGSVALAVGPEPYDVSSAVGVAPEIFINPGQHCETADGESLEMSMRLGVRTWGHAIDAKSVLLTGTYEHHSALGADLLAALPTPLIVARPDPDPLVGAARRRAGQRRARPADRARSAARHAHGRHAAGLVRGSGSFGAGVVARSSRPDRRRGVAVDPRRARARLDDRHAGRGDRHEPGRTSPAASPRSSASR